ncbi:unnamed protein product [Enterobius vermicularis]|uniref:Exonuclease domain-containing protein n=1 Tax=Enterobius vermicularis TaxID=51028 RepID=A0A0N4V757_ENTVE|nr:unnamed protein product [Enterobius vermicularis]
MIGRSEHFADIVCPFDEQGCSRPYCHFWHSKDEAVWNPGSYSASSSTTPSGSMFMGYVGYVGSEASQVVNGFVSYPATTNGYVGSIASTSSAAPSETMYRGLVESSPSTSKERPRKRITTPVESVSKPKLPVELAVDDILDPSRDKVKETRREEDVCVFTPCPKKEMKLHDYVKSVAVLDTRIEELQRALEKQKREKEKMISEFKAKAKNGVDYVPSKKCTSKDQKKQSSTTSRLPAYAGGYTPTPIAVLKSKAEKKNKALSDVTEDGSLPPKVKSGKPKEELEKRLSIEDLFDEQPPEKKPRVATQEQDVKTKQNYVWTKDAERSSKLVSSEKADTSTKLDLRTKSATGSKVSAEQNTSGKKRIALAPSSQSYFQRLNTTKKHVPNVAQQLVYRYERLQKEKEEIMKKVQEKTAQSGKSSKSVEDDFKSKPTGSGSLPKGEKRVAHTASSSKFGSDKLIPLDPFSTGKVPYTLRMRYLQMFYDEFRKITDSPAEALVQAQQEEKVLKDKAVTKGGYTCSAVNVLRRLREATKGAPLSSETKSVSHAAVLEGKHHGLITVGKRKHVASVDRPLSESSFYDALNERYLLSEEQLEKNGFPLWTNDEKKTVRITASERDARKKMFVLANDLKRICCRCGAEFRLTPELEYDSVEQCVYHWGRAFKTRTQGTWESRYSCCSSDLSVKGCCVADYHVTDSACISELQAFTETPPPTGKSDPRSRRVYALDCEMVYTTRGLCLARISVVDIKDELALDILVRPRYPIVDCNTRFSGLTKEQLEKAEYSFEKAQERLFELVNAETILIGHSLESDLKAMRLVHRKVVDTSVVFPHRLGPPYKRALKTIAAEVLQLIIQEDVAGHDSKEDSSACMRLMLNKVKQG